MGCHGEVIPTLGGFARNARRGVAPYGDDVRPTNPDLPPVALADLPRAMHYGEFYGLKPMPASDKPLLVVHGNCQAESIRLLLQDAEDAPCVSVRVPAVHELTADEIPFLKRLLERAAVVLTQPVSDGYHDLPLGASEVHAAAPAARLVRWPVIRYAGLLPWQVVFSHQDEGDPPVVPYHDVRTMMLALGETSDGGPGGHPCGRPLVDHRAARSRDSGRRCAGQPARPRRRCGCVEHDQPPRQPGPRPVGARDRAAAGLAGDRRRPRLRAARQRPRPT